MNFTADLHIHSRFSRATAKTLNFSSLYLAARQKGLHVVGTGDFTHPGWFEEIRQHLVPAEPGLFKLREDMEAACEKQLRVKTGFPVRFMLTCEISNIYKKDGVTRKTHNLVMLPELAEAARFNSRLEQIGNIRSDGRPILGLDTRDLLEILLETSDAGYLIPAHIWTPWFSMFGSKSGFDSVKACFGDLTPHIFAVETGLSSDPPMNWRVGDLDGLTLVSNSDAHSPANLAREANIFHTELNFHAIRDALETGDPGAFGGTLEFFPQEGKYHQDGHRKCQVNLHPKQALEMNGICPECGHPLTLGVLHRVEELATRKEGEKPDKTHPFHSVIPLAEILSEIVGTGPKSKKVQACYQGVLETLGPELAVLHTLPVEAVDEAGIPLLTEAIRRMRAGEVHIFPGFDGQYGEIKVFAPNERDKLIGQQNLFKVSGPDSQTKSQNPASPKSPGIKKETGPGPKPAASPDAGENSSPVTDQGPLAGLNAAQERAVRHEAGPLMIVAGPGTGKTRTLTCRIAFLLQTRRARPDQILALTFTNKAALEMSRRIGEWLGKGARPPLAATFHAFCSRFLKETGLSGDFVIIDDYDRRELVREAIAAVKKWGRDINCRTEQVFERIIAAKQQILSPGDDLSQLGGEPGGALLAAVYKSYQQLLEMQQLCDYEDLIFKTVGLLESDARLRSQYQERFPYIFVDEYQDLNYGQYRIIRALTRPESDICVIGDPDQSIYGFRGSDVHFFKRFSDDFPVAASIRLKQNYRSTETILEAAHQIISGHSLNKGDERVHSGIEGPRHIRLLHAPTEKAEAVTIGKTIEAMVGGTGFYFDDFGGNEGTPNAPDHSFSDFAVLFRTRGQGELLAETLGSAGIPFQLASKKSLYRRAGVQEILSCLKLLEGCGTYADLEVCLPVLSPELASGDIQTLREWGQGRDLALNGLMAEAERTSVEGLSGPGRTRLELFFKQLSAFTHATAGLTASGKLSYLEETPEFQPLCRSDADSREAFGKVLALAETFDDNTGAFIEAAALQSDPDSFDSRSQKVALLTLHAAKGLEFPVVFVAGCEDGLIPLRFGGNPASDPDEERRLFYVAMTRAQTRLFLTHAGTRRVYGRNEKRAPSPFLPDIENRLLSETKCGTRPKPRAQQQMNLF